jgi:hypothetical protein
MSQAQTTLFFHIKQFINCARNSLEIKAATGYLGFTARDSQSLGVTTERQRVNSNWSQD